jgi:PAS domain S-box-containing protein
MKIHPAVNAVKARSRRGKKESGEFHSKLLEFSLDVICLIDVEGKFIKVSSACKKAWGYEPFEMEGKYCPEFVIPEDWAITQKAGEDIHAGVDVTNFENRYLHKDGRIVPMLWSARWDEEEKIMYCVAKDLTDLKKEVEKQQLQQERLRRAYQLAGIAWWEYEVATQTFTGSREIFDIYGLEVPENNRMTLHNFLSYVHPDDKESLVLELARAGEKGFIDYEHRVLKAPGEVVHLIHYAEVIRDGNGAVVSVHGSAKNITRHKLQHLKLQESEKALQSYSRKLTDILESIGDGFCTVDRDWTVTYWNHKAEELLVKKREEMLGKHLWEEFREAVSLDFYHQYHKAMNEGVAVHFEEFFPPLKLWVEVSAYPSNEGLAIYFKDISERKRQEIRLEFIAKATSEVIWEREAGSDFVEIDGEKFQKTFGYDIGSNYLRRSFWADKIHPADVERVMQTKRHALASSRSTYLLEYRFRKADGSWAYVKDRTFVVRNSKGEMTNMIGAMEDVTKRKLAEEALLESEKKYRNLFESAPLPTLICDAETHRYLDVNTAAIEHFGYSREEFLSMKVMDLRPSEEEHRVMEFISNLQDTQAFNSKGFQHRKKNGEVILTEVTASIIQYKGRKSFIATIKDVTENVKLQEKLMQERVAQQKEISKAIIATQEKERSEIGKELHDNVNQVLTTVKLYIENIHSYPEHRDMFIQKGVALTQQAINEIRFLARQLVPPVINDLGFRTTVEEMVTHYRSLNVFELDLDISVEDREIEREMQLTIYRIVQEQLNNIVKYAQASLVRIVVENENGHLRVVVSDNGRGFDTAKTGDGIGLKNIRNRAEVFKGKVILSSSQGAGTSLTILFANKKIQ